MHPQLILFFPFVNDLTLVNINPDFSLGSKHLEVAGDCGREQVAHGIVLAQTGVLHVVVEYLKAISCPLLVEEDIGQVKVDCEEEHVEELANDKHDEVQVVMAHY